MKNILLTGIALLLVLAMAGCDFGTGSVSSPAASDYSDEAAALASQIVDADDNGVADSPFNVSTIAAGTGAPFDTFEYTSGQSFTISFVDGVVDSDSLSNIAVYPISDPDTTNTYEVWTRGTALSITTETFETAAGSNVTVTMNLSSATSNFYEVVVGPGVTANGGALSLNEDSDLLGGETEDEWVSYFNVAATGANPQPASVTAVASGDAQDRQPRGNFSVPRLFFVDASDTQQTFDGGQGNITDTAVPSSVYVEFNAPGIGRPADTYYNSIVVPNADVMTLQQFSDGQWTDISATYPLVTTLNSATVYATYGITASFANGGIYRFKIDNNWQSAEFNGYPAYFGNSNQFQSGWNDSNTFWVLDSDNETVPNEVVGVDITAPTGSATFGNGVIEVQITDDAGGLADNATTLTEIDPSTVTADVFKVYKSSDPEKEIAITSVSQKSAGSSTFVLAFDGESVATGEVYNVELLPGVIDLGATTTGTNAASDNKYLLGDDDFPKATTTIPIP